MLEAEDEADHRGVEPPLPQNGGGKLEIGGACRKHLPPKPARREEDQRKERYLVEQVTAPHPEQSRRRQSRDQRQNADIGHEDFPERGQKRCNRLAAHILARKPSG